MDSRRMPIHAPIPGMQIEIVPAKRKKSQMRDFRAQGQYIDNIKAPGNVTEFDGLQKIGNTQLDTNLNDEGKIKNKKKRVWDKATKNFKFTKDTEDKFSKDQKGRLAYQKWKKTTHLSLQKVGEAEDTEKTKLAKDYWVKRRKFARGWKENKEGRDNTRNRKKNEVIRKKIKKRLIGASRTATKGRSGKSGGGSKRTGKGRR